jgi:phage shock protein PspC (stress-responsive transcriptional regulator)
MNHKKLTRSVSNRVLAGVCGGLGNYLDIDPIVFRVLFCVFGLTGSGIIAYIILMFVVPSENDVAPPFSSQGINDEWIREVSKEVKEEVISNVKKQGSVFSIVAGILLISIGFFCLFPWFHFRFFFPVALIFCGILLLLFYHKKS